VATTSGCAADPYPQRLTDRWPASRLGGPRRSRRSPSSVKFPPRSQTGASETTLPRGYHPARRIQPINDATSISFPLAVCTAAPGAASGLFRVSHNPRRRENPPRGFPGPGRRHSTPRLPSPIAFLPAGAPTKRLVAPGRSENRGAAAATLSPLSPATGSPFALPDRAHARRLVRLQHHVSRPSVTAP
jgi:hypothetical protein